MDQDKLQTVFHAVIRAHVNNTALEDFNPADLSRVAVVNKVSRTELSGDHHWRRASGKWTPEYCGLVKTFGDKPFKTLARRWWGGDPGMAAILGQAHGAEGADEGWHGVLAIEISPDDPLTAFSIGLDESLICTDLATNQIRASVPHAHGPDDDNVTGLCVLGSQSGLVCTAGDGSKVKVWAINQLGNAPDQQPAFTIDVSQPGAHESGNWSVLSAGRSAGHDCNQLLTGGWDGKVCLWDVRNPTGPPVRRYEGAHNYGDVLSLAIDMPRRNLYGGCDGRGIVCWDLVSGVLKARMPCPNNRVRKMVVGKDCLVALAYDDEEWHTDSDDSWHPEEGIGGVWEWGHIVRRRRRDVPHRAPLTLRHNNAGAWPTSILGLGEGPEMLVAGTSDGCIRLMERAGHPVRNNWELGGQPYPDVPVTALAATDNVLVAGYGNGALQIFPMNTPY